MPGNRLDHVAFFGHDLEKTLAGLDELGVAYDVHPDRLYLDGKMVQVFLKDPNGINVELGKMNRLQLLDEWKAAHGGS